MHRSHRAPLLVIPILALSVALALCSSSPASKQASDGWQTAHVTSYATWEFGGYGLTGCSGHVCYTACLGTGKGFATLVDTRYQVAVNDRLGWSRSWCGRHILVKCKKSPVCWRGYHRFMIADTTGCYRSYCDMELSYASSRLMGAPNEFRQNLTWQGYIQWKLE